MSEDFVEEIETVDDVDLDEDDAAGGLSSLQEKSLLDETQNALQQFSIGLYL